MEHAGATPGWPPAGTFGHQGLGLSFQRGHLGQIDETTTTKVLAVSDGWV